MPLGVKLKITVHAPLEIDHKSPVDFIEKLEKHLHKEILQY